MKRALADRIGVVAATLNADPRESARLARIAGFRGVLFDVRSAAVNLPELSLTGRREFRKIITSQDQELIGLRMDLGGKGMCVGADVDQQISRIEHAMEAAAGLQARLLCIDLGPLPRPTVAMKPRPKVTQEMAGLIIIPELSKPAAQEEPVTAAPPDPKFVSQIESAMIEIGQRADRYGVMLALSSSLAGLGSLLQAIQSARCPWFGIDLDPVALLRDEWSKDDFFSSAGELIRHVRARDAIVGDDNRTRPSVIGYGSTHWEELAAMLDDSGYNGWLSVDPGELNDRSLGAVEGLKKLRSLGR